MSPDSLDRRMTQLEELEAESIYIMREVAAEFENPVMMYSIGKDSSVMLRLALQGLPPRAAAVPAAARGHDLEVSRDDRVSRSHRARAGAEPARARERGRREERGHALHARQQQVHRHHEDRRPAPGAVQVQIRRRLRRRAPRRGEVARQGARVLASAIPSTAGIRRTSVPSCGSSTTRACTRARAFACSRSRTGPSSTCGCTCTAKRFPWCRCTSPSRDRSWTATACCIMVDDDRIPLRAGREAAHGNGALSHARLLSAHRRGALHGEHAHRDHRGDAREHHVRAPGPRHRLSTRRPRWRRRSARAISDEHRGRQIRHRGIPRPPRTQGAAAVHHLRQRRRRQEHADRTPAARQPRDSRGPARGRAQRQRALGHAGRRASTWRCSSTACRPSASRASPSTWPTATSTPSGASSSSPTRPATSSTRATWRRAHPPRISRSSSSTPRAACRCRRAGTASSCRSSASATSSSRSTRWTWSITTAPCSTASGPPASSSWRAWACPTCALSPCQRSRATTS